MLGQAELLGKSSFALKLLLNQLPDTDGFFLGNQRCAKIESDFADFKSGAFNKFEETVLPQFPPIARLKQEMLSLGADFALMSGSGASVFGVFPSRLQAENAAKKLAPTVRYEAVTDFFCGFLR